MSSAANYGFQMLEGARSAVQIRHLYDKLRRVNVTTKLLLTEYEIKMKNRYHTMAPQAANALLEARKLVPALEIRLNLIQERLKAGTVSDLSYASQLLDREIDIDDGRAFLTSVIFSDGGATARRLKPAAFAKEFDRLFGIVDEDLRRNLTRRLASA